MLASTNYLAAYLRRNDVQRSCEEAERPHICTLLPNLLHRKFGEPSNTPFQSRRLQNQVVPIVPFHVREVQEFNSPPVSPPADGRLVGRQIALVGVCIWREIRAKEYQIMSQRMSIESLFHLLHSTLRAYAQV